MRLVTDRFRTGMRSIISTATLTTIIQATFRPFLSSSIGAATSQSHDMLALAACAGPGSSATRSSDQSAALHSGEKITRGLSESAEPAYNITIERDECYFVRGIGGARLVSNSSHGSDAAGMMAIVAERETRAHGSLYDDWEEPVNIRHRREEHGYRRTA
jgi:hypothetical protein